MNKMDRSNSEAKVKNPNERAFMENPRREIRSLCIELLRLAQSDLKILLPGDPAWREVKKLENACNEFSGAFFDKEIAADAALLEKSLQDLPPL